MYKRELNLFKLATFEPDLLLTRLSGAFPSETLIETMRPVSYLSEKLSKTLKPFENTQSGFSFKEKHHRVKWEALDTEIHAFGLDDTIHHKNSSIYIFVYRAKLQHVNTFSGAAPLTCDGI